LIDDFEQQGQANVRSVFASRLPIQVILSVCGLPPEAEPQMRRWYDSFEAALANFTGESEIRATARRSVAEFHALLDDAINSTITVDVNSLLARLVHAPSNERLSDDEIKRNLSIVFFGGISTGEALLLNCLWALFEHLHVLQRVQSDLALLPQLVEETMRWMSPVQSATRHVITPFRSGSREQPSAPGICDGYTCLPRLSSCQSRSTHWAGGSSGEVAQPTVRTIADRVSQRL
jgi:cytochrome P450